MIDAHQHLGPCRVFDLEVDESALTQAAHDSNLTGAVIQPFPGAPDPIAVHDRIAAFTESADFPCWGLASLTPHQDDETYRSEVRRCVQDLGFVGVKLHTIGHAVNPGSEDAVRVFEVAQELDIPVMIHTGDGVPFADPAAILPRALEFPQVRIVIAHAGGGMFAGSAMAVAQVCSNVYLETSWCKTPEIGLMIEKLGADRVMIGADLPFNIAPELNKYTALRLSARDEEAALSRTASEVFRIDPTNK
jgi:predicted TIM-barrel fold metal-dependent hydrolase